MGSDRRRRLGRGGGRHRRAARRRSVGKRWSLRHHHGERGVGARAFWRLSSRALGRFGEGWIHYGPWLIAIGVWLTLWELTTAKFGWLPKPFFSPPNGLLNVYVTEWSRLLDLHRLHAAPVVDRLRLRRGRWLRARRRARLVEALQLLGHADPQADRTGAGDRLDSLHVLLLPDDLRRERVHRRAVSGHSDRDPHLLGRRLRQSRLLRRRPQPRRERMVPRVEDRRARVAAARVRRPVHGASTIPSPSSSWRRCSAPNSGLAGTSSSRPPIRATPTSMRRSSSWPSSAPASSSFCSSRAIACSAGKRGSSDGGDRNGVARSAGCGAQCRDRHSRREPRVRTRRFAAAGARVDRPFRRGRRVRRAARTVGMRQIDPAPAHLRS